MRSWSRFSLSGHQKLFGFASPLPMEDVAVAGVDSNMAMVTATAVEIDFLYVFMILLLCG